MIIYENGCRLTQLCFSYAKIINYVSLFVLCVIVNVKKKSVSGI